MHSSLVIFSASFSVCCPWSGLGSKNTWLGLGGHFHSVSHMFKRITSRVCVFLELFFSYVPGTTPTCRYQIVHFPKRWTNPRRSEDQTLWISYYWRCILYLKMNLANKDWLVNGWICAWRVWEKKTTLCLSSEPNEKAFVLQPEPEREKVVYQTHWQDRASKFHR